MVAAFGTDQSGGTRLMFMQSNGGLTDARMFHERDAILLGPLGATDRAELGAGDVFVIETPGGGGFCAVEKGDAAG